MGAEEVSVCVRSLCRLVDLVFVLYIFILADVVLICTVQTGREAGPVDIH
jgi:hypothetical protein